MKYRITPLKRQTGVVMVVSLVMLLILTLIGITGTQVTSMEVRMAGNSQDQNIAFQAAESVLLEAEKFIMDNSVAIYKGDHGLLGIADDEPDFFESTTWTAAKSSSTVGFGGKFVNNAKAHIADPRYIIKKIYQNGKRSVFRITARAQGISPGTQVVLQAIFERNN